MLDPLGKQVVGNGVQGVLMLLVTLMGSYNGNGLFFLFCCGKHLGPVEEPAQLLHDGFFALFRGDAESLMLCKAQGFCQD